MKQVIAIFALFLASSAMAWQPNKPIASYIGYGAGSGNEMIFRIVTAQIEKENPGVSFAVQVMPGADGAVSVNHTYAMPPNGLSLNVTSTVGTYAVTEVFAPETMKYRSIDDLYPVMSLGSSPMAVVARPSSQVNNVTDLVKYLKDPKNPVSVGFGGQVPFVLFGMIMDRGQGDYHQVKPIFYKGPAQAVADVAGGHIEFAILPTAVAAPLIAGNKVKLIGLGGERRLPNFPKTQTINEVLPGAELSAMWSLTLPKGTPKEITDWYVRVFTQALKNKEVQQKLHDNFMVPAQDLTPEQTHQKITQLREQLVPLARKLKIKFLEN